MKGAADEEKETFENKWNPRTIWYAPRFLFTDSQRRRRNEERLILRSSPCDLVSSSTCLMITLKRFSLCLLMYRCVETGIMLHSECFSPPPRPVQYSQSHSAYRPDWLVSDWSGHVDGKLQLTGPSTKTDGQKPRRGSISVKQPPPKKNQEPGWMIIFFSSSLTSLAPWVFEF